MNALLAQAAQHATHMGQALQAASQVAAPAGPAQLQQIQQTLQALQQGQQIQQQTLQALQQGQQDLQQGQQDLKQGQQELQQTLVPVIAAAARSHNFEVIDDAEPPLMGVPDAAGNVPAGFPLTRAALRAMDGPALSALLLAYNVPPLHDVEARRQQLARFIHLRLPA
ncbi:hypothetical protein HYH03_009543 [Edaphochlamys debaryana]|uniref:Uncharacterized protein n=1 Tax=Edaphochlamys debaryana TaxID=47281 RepID=A0A835XY12_9CHLO|nr:hypothetical protein HYH03_009543 [Edaphochlamys debaryana]|eukprot:KAG2492303.1 hypothetical protein HYH03_009543 [Edaphochlamys debaryana]